MDRCRQHFAKSNSDRGIKQLYDSMIHLLWNPIEKKKYIKKNRDRIIDIKNKLMVVESWVVGGWRKIKEEIVPFALLWIDLENIMLSEISQSEKDKYHMISLLCGI